jgi:large subunit ribosomal protein L9
MQVILLEKVEKLGTIGDVVTVKPGFARNFLLPQDKALRATKENIAYFEAQKKHNEKANDDARKDAEKLAKKVDGVTVILIRQASEGGQLYGSVTSRDIAELVNEKIGEANAVERKMVVLDQNYKTLGLFPVKVMLHPEVLVSVTINIARSEEEAKVQEERGEALILNDAEADLAEQAVQAVVEEEVEAEAEDTAEAEAEETTKEESAA